ncbi:MAG: flagellar hook-associated protein FlgK [Sporomusaceae bacterium]|nr:flagellar hook-associated protein FlgK [Sporomusaceae bacterium]
MTSTFGTYSIAYSGMYVNQAGLTATGANLANINTTGASRVRVAAAEKTTDQLVGPSVGSGVSVAEINRARNQLLDSTYRQQNAKTGYWSVKNGDLEYMQEIISEFAAEDGTSTDGLQGMVDDFFTAWEELAKTPAGATERQSVTEAAASLLGALSALDNQLRQLQADAVSGVRDGVASLNDLASQIADLNSRIVAEEVSGGEASYLRDQRDALLDEMSALANITAAEQKDGSVKVSIGGMTMVTGATCHTLEVTGDGGTTSPLQITWADSGYETQISGGSIKAYLEDADQTGYAAITAADLPYNFTAGATSSISNLRQGINDLVTTLAIEINELHSAGYNLNGDAGEAFFTVVDSGKPLSITNIQINPTIADDPDKLAAAGSDASGDNTVADAICALAGEDCYKYGGLAVDIGDFYENLISWLGTTGDDVATNYDTQSALTTQVDNERLATMSISMDEEMANMLMYQQAYTAAARVLSTLDSLLGEMISELG